MGYFRIYCVPLLFLIAVNQANGTNKTACIEKEKSIALLDLAEDLLLKVKRFYPSCENATVANNSECGMKEKALAYLEVTQKLISEAKEHHSTCNQSKIIQFRNRPVDCSDILANGHNTSGAYTIWPLSRVSKGRPLEVYCDMETDGGGWTVIQRRGDFEPLQDFYQDWETYKKGFGNITRDFWLGNDNIYALSNHKECNVRFDLEDAKGEKGFAVYQNFWVDDEAHNYALHISNYSGNVGDAMSYHNGKGFSTKGKNNIKCAQEKQSGWWFDGCARCNLNGLYQPGSKIANNVYWHVWKSYETLAGVEIKIRAK